MPEFMVEGFIENPLGSDPDLILDRFFLEAEDNEEGMKRAREDCPFMGNKTVWRRIDHVEDKTVASSDGLTRYMVEGQIQCFSSSDTTSPIQKFFCAKNDEEAVKRARKSYPLMTCKEAWKQIGYIKASC